MKNIKNFKQFINEGIDQDYALDLYEHLLRIIGIHEKYYHEDNKIINDPEFKSKLAGFMNDLIDGKDIKAFIKRDIDEYMNTEKVFNTICDYEEKHYGERVISEAQSLYSVIAHIVEDTIEEQDALTVNDYIINFSENDIYEYADESNEEKFTNKDSVSKNKVVMCLNNKEKNGYEHTHITVGNTYVVVGESEMRGVPYYELEEDDDLLPDKKYPKVWFMDYDEKEESPTQEE